MSSEQDQKAGAIALVGSGEYTDAMNDTDLYLMGTIGGPAAAKVVIIPTASGLEDPSSPERWQQMGLAHFSKLGAQVKRVDILNRADANDQHWVPLLEEANFYYFSGGNPQHLIETMRDSLAWSYIQRGYLNGAVLAGCSAGAMSFGGYTANIRAVMRGDGPSWSPALGLLPRLITMPHFDRISGFAGPAMFKQMLEAVPEGSLLVGVDEDTALVRTSLEDPARRWQVIGRQTVSLFNSEGASTVFRSGDYVQFTEI